MMTLKFTKDRHGNFKPTNPDAVLISSLCRDRPIGVPEMEIFQKLGYQLEVQTVGIATFIYPPDRKVSV